MKYIICWLAGIFIIAVGIGILFEWVLEQAERDRR